MSRRKGTSPTLEIGRQRLAGLKSIDPNLDLGNGLSVTLYEAEINAYSSTVDSYNQERSALDEKQNAVVTAERKLREKNRRILSAVEAKYGPDSSEYEQVGGTRVSDRKRPTRKSNGNPPQGAGSPTS